MVTRPLFTCDWGVWCMRLDTCRVIIREWNVVTIYRYLSGWGVRLLHCACVRMCLMSYITSALFWTPMVSAVRKLIILSDNCSFRTLVFLMEYRQNPTSLRSHIRFAIKLVHGWGYILAQDWWSQLYLLGYFSLIFCFSGLIDHCPNVN